MNRAERRRQQKKAEKAAKVAKPGQAASRSPEKQTLTIQQAIDLAVQHHTAGRLPQAESIYQQILQADPNQPVALQLLGVVAHQERKDDIAVDLITRALAIKPDYAEAHSNLGNVLQHLGRLEEAVACYQKALDAKPDDAGAAAMLLHQLQHACAWRDFDILEQKVRALTTVSIKEGQKIGVSPFVHITHCPEPSENHAVARAWSREITQRMASLKVNFPLAGRRARSSKITIGYLSCDFRSHPLVHLMRSFFGLHDRRDFNVFTYSYGPDDGSDYRKGIERDSDRFFDVRELDYAGTARQIHDSGVDILVDLTGHTQHSRMEICALRPAPVQVAYMGFPGTCGADFFDYILTDRIVTPESEARHYSEKFAFLPHCYMVTDHTQTISDAPVKRADFGLPEHAFVFCSFNHNYKFEPVMFDVWMNLLKEVPHSVLWLLKSNNTAEQNLKREAEARGVEADRLIFAGRLPKDQHLARFGLADLALDTRIYGGHTTTSDALWSGVPVVAMLGSHFASRVSSSVLTAISLPELIAHSLEEYESLALRLSKSPEELAALRAKLAQNRTTEPLFDTPRSVRNFENAYRRMWDCFLAGEAPRQIDVVEEIR